MKKYSLGQFLDIKASFAPVFSPDDSRISYVDNSSGTMQVYTVNVNGTDVRQITDYPDRILFAGYTPAKDLIVFGKDRDGDEHTQFHVFDVESGTVRDLTDNPKVLHRAGGISRDSEYLAYASNQRNGRDFDIYVMHLATGESRCVFENEGWCDASGFSCDGTRLVVSRRASNTSNDLVLVDPASLQSEVVASGNNNTLHFSPRWLSDSSGFYFVSNRDSDFTCIDFYSLNSETTERVLEFGWDVQEIALSNDDSMLAITINEDGYHTLKLYEVDNLTGISMHGIPPGMISGARWSHDDSKLVFNHADPTRTVTVWIWDRLTGRTWQVTPDHQAIPPEDMVLPELVHYSSFDGLKIPSFIYRPKAGAGLPLPVVVQIHGGPESQYQPYFNPLTQYLVHNGYAVAAPNVRGSTGYGRNYMELDDREKRLDSVRDIVHLYHYIKECPDLDENRIALTGGSYGGYMVLANLAFYPEYWAAGVDIVGISNLVSFLENTSVWRRAMREAEYGYLATDREMLEKYSPMNRAENIVAPMMIIHGANDPRVPLSEAEQMYNTLRALDRDVELLVYHDEGHGLAKLENRIDAWTRVVEFLDKRLKRKP